MITIYYQVFGTLKYVECTLIEMNAHLQSIKSNGGVIIGIANDSTYPKLVKTY